MLLRPRYRHVGKTALLTTRGNLILDPSALESSWRNELRSLNFHRNPAYKIAFTVVCLKHLHGMDSGILNFLVNRRGVRKWERQCEVNFTEQQVATLVSENARAEENQRDAENVDEASVTGHNGIVEVA